MTMPIPTTGDESAETRRSSLTRWRRLFYALVVFAVLTVFLSVYLSRKYMDIYVRSVEVNQKWTERLNDCSRLGHLVGEVNAPGNNVFQSDRIAEEQARMQAALSLFNLRAKAFEEALRADAEGDEVAALAEKLPRFRQNVEGMAREALNLFAYMRRDETRKAGESMAAMDRHFAQANQVLEQLRADIAAIQQRHFLNQTAAAGSLQKFQDVASVFILALIVGSAVYGHRVRRQVEDATREKEGLIQALRDSEAQLDRRVRERTAELVEANASLRKEVEERRRAEEALRQSEDRYRGLVEVRQQLLKKLMSAQEDERGRIARDLHDEIGQALTSLLIGLRTIVDAATPEAARARAEDLRRITAAALEEVRRLARGLRPSVLDDHGLTAALERYVADYSLSHAIEVEVEAPDLDRWRMPGEVETALYRIAQEALTNTARHAGAKRARIVVEREPGFVQLEVSDDGRGLADQEPDSGTRLGLSGMQERAALLNGSVAVESDPGKGTRIRVRIPCAEVCHGDDPRCSGR
jgi:signal transduction histidine kinase